MSFLFDAAAGRLWEPFPLIWRRRRVCSSATVMAGQAIPGEGGAEEASLSLAPRPGAVDGNLWPRGAAARLHFQAAFDWTDLTLAPD